MAELQMLFFQFLTSLRLASDALVALDRARPIGALEPYLCLSTSVYEKLYHDQYIPRKKAKLLTSAE